MNCIETKNLGYRFSESQTVLSSIHLQVPEGSIYGFLGPNGAGKTTTLKLILGLLKKQEGSISVFNTPFDANRIEILKKVGSLIESPSLYGHLSAADNLEILRRIYRCPKERIAEVLEIVGLSGTGTKKARQFSLGMKQRLSIAVALLHNPPLLILDEPTNGLDPNGIIEIRELLRNLNNTYKTTIVISSHLLSEIEKIVSHVGILNRGVLLFQGTLQELQLKQAVSSGIRFGTSDPKKALSLLLEKGVKAELENSEIVLHTSSRETAAEMNALLVHNNISVFQMSPEKNDLESIFIDLTKN
ncbi:MAG: Sulfate-transporting ATPase [Bacteroidetes bacterium]|jgi:ABC-2 type transport system ATP-binding protein|nr:Sulfate-transporting ATPase [Bacteroidota bacterium]